MQKLNMILAFEPGECILSLHLGWKQRLRYYRRCWQEIFTAFLILLTISSCLSPAGVIETALILHKRRILERCPGAKHITTEPTRANRWYSTGSYWTKILRYYRYL